MAELRFFAAADHARARRDLAAAVHLAAVAQDATLAAYARTIQATLWCVDGEVAEGLPAMEAGLAALEALPRADRTRELWRQAVSYHGVVPGEHDPRDVLAHMDLRGNLVIWLAHVGRFAEVRAAGAPFLGAPTPRPVRGMGHSNYALAYVGLARTLAAEGQPAQAQAAYVHTRAVFRAVGCQPLLGHIAQEELAFLQLPCFSDDLAGRRHLAAEALEAFGWARGAEGDQDPRLALLPLLFVEGEWAETRRLALAARARDVINSGPRLVATLMLGLLACVQGDSALAWTVIRGDLPAGPATAPGNSFFATATALQRLAAALALAAGDLPTAYAWLDAHDRWLAWSGSVLGRAEDQLAWTAYYRAAGNAVLACEHGERALAQATAPRQPLALLAAHRLLGELDTVAGQDGAARTHLDVALTLADACAAPYERALTLLALAEWHAATGQPAEARARLDAACALLEPLAARPALARAATLTTRLALLQAPRPRYPAGLTAREVEVLRLVAQGQTNHEIAATLCLSFRTVERHLANVYTKLAAHGRADATAFAFRHHLL